MKIVFAGTPEFAKEHLKILLRENNVDLVLTQPDRKAGRGNKLTPSPVKVLAQKNNIRVLQPKTLKGNLNLVNKLRGVGPHIILVVAYGLIVPKEILNIPKLGCINIHASILPRWRGASPIESAIINGDNISGLSFMKMDEGLDTGPVLQSHTCVLSSEENSESLTTKLLSISDKELNNFIKKLELGQTQETKQKKTGITYAKKIDRKDTEIVWDKKCALDVDRMVRAFYPKMGAFTYIGQKRIKILRSSAVSNRSSLLPGEISIDDSGEMLVGCSKKTNLKVILVQLEGKKPVLCKDFVRENKDLINAGYKFNTSE